MNQLTAYSDTFLVSGTLRGSNLPALPWTGATGTYGLKNARTGEVVVDNVALTSFTVATGAFTYQHAGTTIPEGEYLQQIRVTFSGGVKRRFPNGAAWGDPITVLPAAAPG